MDLTQIDLDALYCMFKGEPGTRKSTQALSFPKPQYWFTWDQKSAALMIPMIKWGINPTEVKLDDYSDWDAACAKLKSLLVACPFRTLVFDSITSCADFTLGQTLALKGTKKSGEEKGKVIGGIPVTDIEDYNAESAALQELIALTKKIKKAHKVNIILIAHVIQAEYRNTVNNTTHISRTIVTAGKKVAAKLPAYCDEVYHFNIGKSFTEGGGKYELLTRHMGDDFARTVLPVGDKIEFEDKPIYDTWLLPRINELKEYQKKFQAAKAEELKVNPGSAFIVK